MKLHELLSKNKKPTKRVGRGTGSGMGRTCTRGDNGQGSRKSGNVRPGFEGGQIPLYRKMPKLRGFKSRNVKPQVLNVSDLDKSFEDGDVVSNETLFAKGLIDKKDRSVKILGFGKTSKKFKLEIENLSDSAKKSL